jgi:hypothetical protein
MRPRLAMQVGVSSFRDSLTAPTLPYPSTVAFRRIVASCGILNKGVFRVSPTAPKEEKTYISRAKGRLSSQFQEVEVCAIRVT